MRHFCIIPIVEKEIICLNHQPRKQDDFDHFFKRANGTMAASPPLIVEDSRYTAAKPKARRPLDPILPPTGKSVKRACNLIGIQGRVSLEYLGYLRLYTNNIWGVCWPLL
jgi:hypothetical protein